MITENIEDNQRGSADSNTEQKIIKITKQMKDHLILSDGITDMMFRRYQLHLPSSLEILKKRILFKHESLIKLFKIECQHSIQDLNQERNETNCGILFQRYSKTLAQSFKQMPNYSQQQVFQTLQPIKEVLEYLISQNYDPGQISLSSIVCTQHYEIKLIDPYLCQDKIRIAHRNNFQHLLYEQFAEIMFEILFPLDRNIKSWKCRFQIAENKLEPHFLQIFKSVYVKFAPSLFKEDKSKKIKKQEKKEKQQQKKRPSKYKSREAKTMTKQSLLQSNLKWQTGKENKIIQ